MLLQTTLNDNRRPVHLIFWTYFILFPATAAAGCSMCTRTNWSTKAPQHVPVSERIQKAPGWINSWLHIVQISESFNRQAKLKILHLRYDLIAPLCPTFRRSSYSARDETRGTFSVCGSRSAPEATEHSNSIKSSAPISYLLKSHKSCVDLHPQFPRKLFSVTPAVPRCLGSMQLQKAVLSWWAVTAAVSLPESSVCLETLVISWGTFTKSMPSSCCSLPHAFKLSTANMWYKGCYQANTDFLK